MILAWATVLRIVLWASTGAQTPLVWQWCRQWLLGALAVALAVGTLVLLASLLRPLLYP